MTTVLILVGSLAMGVLVSIMLAYNHRAELDRRRLIRRLDQEEARLIARRPHHD